MSDESVVKGSLQSKYDRIAPTYSSRYADPAAIARRQVALVGSWGSKVGPRARLLEIGCSDGFATEALVRAGYEVTAVDFSPGMVDVARERLAAAGLTADVRVANVDSLDLDGSYDVVLAVMWTFFAYTRDAAAALSCLATRTRVKLLVDLNPRVVPIEVAIEAVREAGFDNVVWRPFLVPQRRRLPPTMLAALAKAEQVPGVRGLPLRWRGNVVVKGERKQPT